MADEELLQAPNEPLVLFAKWFAMAKQSEHSNPEAMSLATVSGGSVPEIRTVLLKKIDEEGLVFFTNSESTKGRNMADNPEVALLFYWRTLDRQIRINGRASPISDAESDAYFASRPRASRLGAWASKQSQPMRDFGELQSAVAEASERFPDDISRPSHWFGYRVVPNRFEFWVQEAGRLHQRIEYTQKEYTRENSAKDWVLQWLYP